MFTTNLNQDWQNYLINLPESGMGYHNVIINGNISGKVFNCTFLKTDFRIDNILDIQIN